MNKELIISTTPQETKLSILEDDELVEYYIERQSSKGIVGNIYKGKVTKVLPGMQSAFVDIGLDRDAFLYVSDFFEDTEEYEKIVSTVEDEVAQLEEAGLVVAAQAPEPEPKAAAPAESESQPVSGDEPVQRPSGRRRERERRVKKARIPSFEGRAYERTEEPIEALPGESLAKHPHKAEPAQKPTPSDIEAAVQDREERAVDTFADQAAAPDFEPLEESGPERQNSGPAPVPPEATKDDLLTQASSTPEEGSSAPPAETMKPDAGQTRKRGADPGKNSETETGREEDLPSSARITDRSDNYRFAHRSPRGRPRRRGVPPPQKTEQRRTEGYAPKGSATISELLREGQEILVQVSKEPLGKKGARITSHIALPGRYLVFMPTVDHVGVSRKIASDQERARLKRIIHDHRAGLPGGFIVRTAAEGRGEDEFVQDIRFLGNIWADIRAKSDRTSAPALIHRDLNLVERVLRDQLSPEFKAIRIDSETEFATVLDFVNKFQPSLVNRVKLHLKDTPIFEEYGLNVELDKALRPKIWLRSGGYIVINQTEALVAIDVNTGKFVGKSNRLEDTIVRTNLDAVHEIVRQIRLRNLGGIIVVDFIDMEEKKSRQRVMAALEEALRDDRAPSKILQFNDFGLVAITRKRTQPSLERTLCVPCSHCDGSGWIKSPETVCYEVQQEIKKMTSLIEGKEITVRMHPEVAKALKSGEYVSLQDLEEWTKKDITVKSDPLLHEEHFDVF